MKLGSFGEALEAIRAGATAASLENEIRDFTRDPLRKVTEAGPAIRRLPAPPTKGS